MKDDPTQTIPADAQAYFSRCEAQFQMWLASRPEIAPTASDGLRIVGTTWPNYNFDHAGHIVCGRGYDWRFGYIYLDDPYPENEYQSGGGDTYGRKRYDKTTVAGGVTASANKQVVY